MLCMIPWSFKVSFTFYNSCPLDKGVIYPIYAKLVCRIITSTNIRPMKTLWPYTGRLFVYTGLNLTVFSFVSQFP